MIRNVFFTFNERKMIQRNMEPSGAANSDFYLQHEVSNRLVNDGSLNASKIGVNVEKGTVTLLGMVNTAEEKRRARDIAEAVPGVQQIENNIQVSGEGGIAATVSQILSKMSDIATGSNEKKSTT